MLAATGRKADVEGLGLENMGVALSDDGKARKRLIFSSHSVGVVQNP